jgi:hypothetical protein
MIGRPIDDSAVRDQLSRRSLVTRATFFGAAIAATGEVAKAEGAGSGSYSNAAIALPDAEGSERPARNRSAPSESHAPCERDRP